MNFLMLANRGIVSLLTCWLFLTMSFNVNAQSNEMISAGDLSRLRAFIRDGDLGRGKTAGAGESELFTDGVYVVRPGDTLGGIMSRHLKDTGINRKVLEQVIVRANKSAFRRGNPHWIMAGAKLRMPTADDVMDYVAPGNPSQDRDSADSWIRFP